MKKCWLWCETPTFLAAARASFAEGETLVDFPLERRDKDTWSGDVT